MSNVDPITRQVIRNSLKAAAAEMQTALIKTAHNPLIYEVQDFGLVITNAEGQMVAEGSGLPGFLACIPPTIKSGIERLGPDTFREGDVLLSNEPDDTGTHISDTVLYTPVFFEGKLVAFTGVMAHWADIGGITPGGWCPNSISVHQEGMMFSHNKIYDAGVPNRDFLRFIFRNVRFPQIVEGDLNAKIAACQTGAKRYVALCQKYGAGTVETAMREVMDASEERMRREIEAIPDGLYEASASMDHDGVELDRSHLIKVAVRVVGDEVHVDWTGTGPAAKGPINHPLVGTAALCATTLKSLTMPFDSTNEGHLRPLTVTAPADTLVSASYPSPVDSYGYVAEVIVHLLVKAFAQAIPDRCPAATYQMVAFHMSRDDARTGKPFIYSEPVDGGGGAFPHADGPSGIMFIGNGDAPNTPVEVVESRYPVRVRRYTFNPNHRGVGRYRGGYGVIRDYEMLEDYVQLQTSIENNKNPLWGLSGGGDAGTSLVVVNEDADSPDVLAERVTFYGPLMKGDTVTFYTPNGGGWGDPCDRPLELIARDVLHQHLDVEAAASIYGREPSALRDAVHKLQEAERE